MLATILGSWFVLCLVCVTISQILLPLLHKIIKIVFIPFEIYLKHRCDMKKAEVNLTIKDIQKPEETQEYLDYINHS